MPRLLKGEGSNQGRVTGTPDVAKPDPLGIVSTAEKLAKPAFSSPTAPAPDQHKGRPIPVLQAHGYHGSIEDVNSRVEQITDSFAAKFGSNPTPGLAFDLLRAPVDDFDSLFDVVSPTDRSAELKGLVQKVRSDIPPHKQLVARADGVLVPNETIFGAIQKALQPLTSQPGPTVISDRPELPAVEQAKLQKRYPWVAANYDLPIPGLTRLYDALEQINKLGGPQFLQEEKHLSYYRQEVQRAQEGTPENLKASVDKLKAVRVAGGDREALGFGANITAVKEAKLALNKVAPQLNLSPEIPVFTEDEAKRLRNYTHSGSYFAAVTKFKAQAHDMSVHDYVKAWKNKQDAVRGNGFLGWFYNAMPIQLFHNESWGTFGSLFRNAPGYIGGGGTNPLDQGLHALTRSSGLALDTMGGTVAQAKANIAAGGELVNRVFPKVLGGKGETYDEALKHVSTVLKQNPSWMRMIFPELPTKGKIAAIDQATNVAGDFLLMGKGFYGGKLKAGDAAAAAKDVRITKPAGWAFRDLARYGNDGIGRAAARLEGSMGAQRLVAVTAKAIHSGRMTEEQFRAHVSDLFTYGHTTVSVGGKEFEASGPVLDSLRSNRIPTPTKAGRTLAETKQAVREAWDKVDIAASGSNAFGSDFAQGYLRQLRMLTSHAAPAGTRGLFTQHLPEGVFNFVVKHDLGDAGLANKLESDLVRFQGRENIPGIQKVQRQIEGLYRAKHPGLESMPSDDPFQGLLVTEMPSRFRFPGGGANEIKNLADPLERGRAVISRDVNRLATLHAKLILGVGLLTPLFWKHLIGGDLVRRVVGGGFKIFRGGEYGQARSEIAKLASSDPKLSRMLGSAVERNKLGEARWLLRRNGGVGEASDFNTGTYLDSKLGGRYFTAAGAKLRGLVDDNALQAYRASSHDDLTPLVQLVLHDKDYRGAWKSARQAEPGLSAEEYAQALAARFSSFEEAGKAAGLSDPLGQAKALLDAKRMSFKGSTQALGKFIKENRIDWHVSKAEVAGFDPLGSYIQNVVMAGNKLHRGGFFKTVLTKQFAELRKAGWDGPTALETAISVGEKQTAYHMLDFVNRLQMEQNLRFLVYFATKHRLYWKWALSALSRQPGMAAVASDFSQHLDDRGQLKLPLNLFGTKWAIPVERLLWIPGKEYSEISPLAQGVWGTIKSGGDLSAGFQAASGTYGNVLTRNDTTVRLGMRLALINAGKLPATYGSALSGFDKLTADSLKNDFNEYTRSYMASHGHPPPEPEAVKHVLLGAIWMEGFRSNLPLPLVPDNSPNPAQTLLKEQYMMTVDPKKRKAILAEHPELKQGFGLHEDPKVYANNKVFFARYASIHDAYRAARKDLLDKAKGNGGFFTPQLELQKRALDAAYSKSFDKLLIEDARKAGVDTKGQVPDGKFIPYGPWGKVITVDPLMQVSGLLSTLFPKLQAEGKLYGATQGQLKLELGNLNRALNDPAFAKQFGYTDVHALKTRRREIVQSLEAFRGYPSDPLAADEQTYWAKHVNPYWKESERRYQAIKKLPRDKQDAGWAEFRAWRDMEDKPVTINGISWPSPARMAWGTQEPQVRLAHLRTWAAKDPAHLTDYELSLLGKKVPSGTSQAWDAFARIMASLRGGQSVYGVTPLAPGQKLTKGTDVALAKYVEKGDRSVGLRAFPGFYKAFLFHKEPTYQRLQVLSVVTESPYQSQWHHLLGVEAASAGKYLDRPGIKDAWRRYASDPHGDLQRWLAQTPTGFQNEVKDFGPDFLNDLLN